MSRLSILTPIAQGNPVDGVIHILGKITDVSRGSALYGYLLRGQGGNQEAEENDSEEDAG